jgi:hypothetical protein
MLGYGSPKNEAPPLDLLSTPGAIFPSAQRCILWTGINHRARSEKGSGCIVHEQLAVSDVAGEDDV